MHPHHSTSTHPPPPPSHPQPPPPTIGQGQSNLFGGIISGNGAPGLAAPPQMSMDPTQQPTNQPGHPGNYPGPSGPPQSVPQAGGSSAHSPYLNGGGPPGTLSQPHTPKRPRIEDGVSSAGPQNPLGMTPSSQQTQPGLYGNNSIPPPQSGQGQPISQGYIPPVGPSSKPGNKISKVH